MNTDDDEPTLEDTVYAPVLGFIRGNVDTIALLAPIPVLVVLPLPLGGPWVGVVWLLIYLGEEIVYRLIAGPGAASLLGRDRRNLLFLGVVVFITLLRLIA